MADLSSLTPFEGSHIATALGDAVRASIERGTRGTATIEFIADYARNLEADFAPNSAINKARGVKRG